MSVIWYSDAYPTTFVYNTASTWPFRFHDLFLVSLIEQITSLKTNYVEAAV